MKKKYDKKIIQYDINGNKLNIFRDRHEAAKILDIHHDSIISCCLKKYKFAGGFVFRFENDSFNIIPSKVEEKLHICNICKSNETIRSMAMHLRFTHKIKTEEYVKQYGEFRPKQLTNNKIKETSEFSCKECGEKMKSNQHLMYHLTKVHPEITQYSYIIKNIYGGEIPLCKCGCGQPVEILRNGKNCDLNKETYNRDYIKGHWDWEVFTNIEHQSKEEVELLNYIKTIYNGEIKTSVRGVIPKLELELDIYLPELNIAIEYNGLYWHCEKNKSKQYHLNKTKECQKLGIRLIQIFSDEWLNKQDIVKSKLKSILNKTDNKIYARKCVIKLINPIEKNNFLDKYHLQGKDKSKIHLGLYYKEELVGVMTFSNPRIALGGNSTNKNHWELSRYATSHNIIGGASKLLQYFIKNYNPNYIYSYSDNRWTNPLNNMYLKIGFKFKSFSNPGYSYTNNFLERTHRYNFRKSRLKEKGLNIEKTEHETMLKLGYYRVWDCGSAKYEWSSPI